MKYTPDQAKKAKEKQKEVVKPLIKVVDGYYIVESKMNYL